MAGERSLRDVDMEQARTRLYQVHVDLQKIIENDQEQEVQGWAVPVLDDVLQAVKGAFLADEPAVRRLQDVMSPEAVASGMVRAIDLYIVLGQLLAAVPPRGGSAFSAADRNL
jgi:hypothetical protein